MNRRKFVMYGCLVSGLVLTGTKFWGSFFTKTLADLEAQKKLLAELAETIIPRTDSPGAKDVQVEEILLAMLINCTDKRSLANFMQGLTEVNLFARKNFGKEFTGCNPLEKEQTLAYLQKQERTSFAILRKVRQKWLGRTFFELLKEYTTIAFCTSLKGTTQAMAYVPIPGYHQACVSMQYNQRAWATQ